MSNSANAYKTYTVVDQLERDLLTILHDNLMGLEFNVERLTLQILITLSKKRYVKQLLFRDFQVDPDSLWQSYECTASNGNKYQEKIHFQAFIYAEELLTRRLTLAQNLNDRPSNMHILLQALCRQGPAVQWRRIVIRRDSTQRTQGEEAEFFYLVAKKLADKRTRLGNDFSQISRNRRTEYGPIWLKGDACAAEVPEELSLCDVLEILPKPLNGAFTEDLNVQKSLARVLDALNERYMLLRSCGLNPEQWLAPTVLSINQLKELKQLRKQARELLCEGQTQDPTEAYRRVFSRLQDNRKKYAGYASFDEFAATEAAKMMLGHADISLDESVSNNSKDETLSRHDTLARVVNADDTTPFELTIEDLITARPELFSNPIVLYCFRQLIGQGRSWYGPGGVICDADFQQLIKANPTYAGLPDDERVKRLSRQLEQLIVQGLHCEDS